jgi:hypothetical protein
MNSYRRELPALATLLLILTLAAYLRLANNANTPGWYTDEGTHLEIAQHLAEGQMQYMAIRQSTFLFAKLPLFELLLAALLTPTGEDIVALRTLTGLLGVITVATLYAVIRRATGDLALALLAALLLAIYPQAALYSRFGFSYNLLAPLVLLTLLGLWGYLNSPASNRAWLALAALSVGLGSISDLWMLSLIAPVLLVILVRRPGDALWSFPLLFLPFGSYTAFMLLTAPEAFLFDLQFTLSRLSHLPLADQLERLATNYTVLATQDQWLALALVGLFLLRPLRLQGLVWLLLGMPILLLGRTEALYHLSFYYMIPLLPFISLGVAALLRYGVPYAAQQLQRLLGDPAKIPELYRKGAAYLAILALVATPFLKTTLDLAKQSQTQIVTAIDPFLIDPQAARYAANFVNLQTLPEDLVIASPGLAWQLQPDVADFQMAVGFKGQPTPHLPPSLPPQRFAFNPDYHEARFVVVDNLWHTWATPNVNGVAQMLEEVQSWPVRFQSGSITVYCNPNQPDC